MARTAADARGHGPAASATAAQAADTGALDLAALEAVASAVPDPELPVVTLGDLGIVRGVSVADDGAVEVRITPTFVGCPATEVIGADVRAAVGARLREVGAGAVEVRTRMVMSPAWSTDWISDAGRRKLAAHGVAPPRHGALAAAAGDGDGARAGAAGAGGGPVFVQISPFPSPNPPTTHHHQKRAAQACPRCGSGDTRELSAFGSTPCQSLRACRACGEPFGAMKSL